MELADRYYLTLAAAYVRGIIPEKIKDLPEDIHQLSEEELLYIFEQGKLAELKYYRFKKTMDLPRVSKVLGILQGFRPTNLLDIGTGRGVFLHPLLDLFPELPINCVDILSHRVEALQAYTKGGIYNLKALQHDVCQLPFDENTFDVVTALEVIEHIPQLDRAVKEVVFCMECYESDSNEEKSISGFIYYL